MKQFPVNLSIKNKHNFSRILFDVYIGYLRKDLYEHILSEDENTYFELDTWCRNNLKNNKKLMDKMLQIVLVELQQRGWKCKTSFGGTGLFVYSSEDPPKSCYEDEL